jgi:hypothetical protein
MPLFHEIAVFSEGSTICMSRISLDGIYQLMVPIFLLGPKMTALQQEIETFNRLLPSLLPQVGKFALIKGDKLIDTFDSYQDAMKHGYAEFKLAPFMVKQIAPAERLAYFTRDLNACPA